MNEEYKPTLQERRQARKHLRELYHSMDDIEHKFNQYLYYQFDKEFVEIFYKVKDDIQGELYIS